MTRPSHFNHAPGASDKRKALPLTSGVIDYFPDALLAVAEISKAGNDQHNPGEELHWARGKSTDHGDAAGRHLIDRGKFDTDGLRHTAKLAWRALAMLQEEIENEKMRRDGLMFGPESYWPRGARPDFEAEEFEHTPESTYAAFERQAQDQYVSYRDPFAADRTKLNVAVEKASAEVADRVAQRAVEGRSSDLNDDYLPVNDTVAVDGDKSGGISITTREVTPEQHDAIIDAVLRILHD